MYRTAENADLREVGALKHQLSFISNDATSSQQRLQQFAAEYKQMVDTLKQEIQLIAVMPNCMVLGCHPTSRADGGLRQRYHKLPADKQLACRWYISIKRARPLKRINAFVCSRHFSDDNYMRDLQFELLNPTLAPANNRNRKLKPGAVPSLNLPTRWNPVGGRSPDPDASDELSQLQSMLPCCVMPDCESAPADRLHQFPVGPLLRHRWLTVCRSAGVLDGDHVFPEPRVCRRHFSPADYDDDGQLLSVAVPSQQLPAAAVRAAAQLVDAPVRPLRPGEAERDDELMAQLMGADGDDEDDPDSLDDVMPGCTATDISHLAGPRVAVKCGSGVSAADVSTQSSGASDSSDELVDGDESIEAAPISGSAAAAGVLHTRVPGPLQPLSMTTDLSRPPKQLGRRPLPRVTAALSDHDATVELRQLFGLQQLCSARRRRLTDEQLQLQQLSRRRDAAIGNLQARPLPRGRGAANTMPYMESKIPQSRSSYLLGVRALPSDEQPRLDHSCRLDAGHELPGSMWQAVQLIGQLRMENAALRARLLQRAIDETELRARLMRCETERAETEARWRQRATQLFTDGQLHQLRERWRREGLLDAASPWEWLPGRPGSGGWASEDYRMSIELRGACTARGFNYLLQRLQYPLPSMFATRSAAHCSKYPEVEALYRQLCAHKEITFERQNTAVEVEAADEWDPEVAARSRQLQKEAEMVLMQRETDVGVLAEVLYADAAGTAPPSPRRLAWDPTRSRRAVKRRRADPQPLQNGAGGPTARRVQTAAHGGDDVSSDDSLDQLTAAVAGTDWSPQTDASQTQQDRGKGKWAHVSFTY